MAPLPNPAAVVTSAEALAVIEAVVAATCGDPKCTTHASTGRAVYEALVQLAKDKPATIRKAFGLL